GRRESKRRRLQVERMPARELLVRSIGEGVGEQPSRPTALEVAQGRKDFRMAEVHEAVAAEYQVDARQPVADHVAQKKTVPPRAELRAITCNQRGDDVDADVTLDAEIEMAQPIEIAARRVKQRARLDAAHERLKIGAEQRSARHVGARP